MISLEQLGNKICIIGPSSSGKSTLAANLGRKLNVPAYHLDQLAHVEGTDWHPRKNEEWEPVHREIIGRTSWIIEGNYRFCMPERFQQATYLIWLDFNKYGCARRYIARSLKDSSRRPGRLQGATSEFSFEMIGFILFDQPKSRTKYQPVIDASGVPLLRVKSLKELNCFYRHWGLSKV